MVLHAGERMQTFQYERSWIARQSDYVKFLRTEEASPPRTYHFCTGLHLKNNF